MMKHSLDNPAGGGNGRPNLEKRAFPGRPMPKRSRRLSYYLGLTGFFFLISFLTIYFVHNTFSGEGFHLDPRLYSFRTLSAILGLLASYYLFDGLRLYFVIRTMGFKVRFRSIMKLVFVNIFVSNITPLATGGGVVQVFFLNREGIPVGESTAATMIRTILAASILFTLTPFIIIAEPNLSNLFFKKNLILYIALFCILYLAAFTCLLLFTRVFRFRLYRFMRLLSRRGILSGRHFRNWYRKISRELGRFVDGFRRFGRGRPLFIMYSILFTGLFLLSLFSFSVVLIRTLGYSVSSLTILAFQVVVTFFMYFAPTPGAAGVAEGGYGLLFSQLVKGQDLASLIFLWRFLTIYIGVFFGLFFVYRGIFARDGAEGK